MSDATTPASAFHFVAFRSYWAAQLLSLVGSWMQIAAQGWLIIELTSSPALIGAVTCAGAAPVLALSLLGGRLASRVDRRKLLIATQLGLALQAALFGALVWTDRLRLETLFALVVSFGVLNAIDLPAQRTFWADLVPRGSIKSAVSLNAAALHASRMAGPALAALLMNRGAHAAVFFSNAASYLITALVLCGLARKTTSASPTPPSSLRELLTGEASAPLRRLLGFVLVNSTCVFPYLIAFVPALVKTRLAGSELALGALMGCSGAGALCGALLVSKIAGQLATRAIAFGSLIAAAALAALAGARALAVAAPSTFVLGAALSTSMAMALARMQELVPATQRGTLMGLHATSSTAVAPFAALAWGVFGEYAGLPAMLSAMAGASTLSTVGLLAAARSSTRAAAQSAPAE